MCQKNLKEYKESLEEDEVLLKKTNLTYNEKNCIILRAGEKRVYSFHIQLATKVIELFNKKLKEINIDEKSKSYLITIKHFL